MTPYELHVMDQEAKARFDTYCQEATVDRSLRQPSLRARLTHVLRAVADKLENGALKPAQTELRSE
jgi:hypothetical protein